MRNPTILLSFLLLCSCDASVSADQGKNHRVQAGESLFAIAERAYGNGLEWHRIWEANPWVDPDNLRAGEIIYVPEYDNSWADPPNNPREARRSEKRVLTDPPNAAPATRISRNPGRGAPGIRVFRDLANTVSSRTVFGLTLEKALLVIFLAFVLHAAVQSVLVWIAANITFVKDVSFKKSLKAVFMAEMLTFATVITVAGVAILMTYLGTTEPSGGSAATAQLFPTLESYLRSPVGLAIASFSLLGLYVILSLRFLPQVLGVQTSHAITLMALAILIPHLVGMYLVGQRTGIIQ